MAHQAHLRFHVRFPEDKVKEPIIYQIGKEYNVVTNVRRADVRETTGWVDVELSGEAADLALRPKADGYWIITRAGGVYGYGNARHLGSPLQAGRSSGALKIRPTPSGNGYWVLAGNAKLGGKLPMNTHGGLIRQAHLGAMHHIVEAALQLRGEADDSERGGGNHQVPGAKLAITNGSGGILAATSALVLSSEPPSAA